MYAEHALIISGSDKGLDGVAGFLKASGCRSVATLFSGSEARRQIAYSDYELIIINTPLQDEFGYDLACKLSAATCSGIILICRTDLAAEMADRTVDAGVSVITKPLNKTAFAQAIRMGIGFNRRLSALYQENNKLRNKLEETRVINRAKFLLITEEQMTEEEAHKTIEKTAMDTRRTKGDVARDIVAKYAQR